MKRLCLPLLLCIKRNETLTNSQSIYYKFFWKLMILVCSKWYTRLKWVFENFFWHSFIRLFGNLKRWNKIIRLQTNHFENYANIRMIWWATDEPLYSQSNILECTYYIRVLLSFSIESKNYIAEIFKLVCVLTKWKENSSCFKFILQKKL